jgi:hypothetical protein
MAHAETSSLLLELPTACMLAILQRCAADDQRSVLSAARAHSRLHQAAVLALHSITAVITRQEQVDSVVLYLSNHGQHVRSASLKRTEEAEYAKLRQLPPGLQLDTLQFEGMHLRLHPGNGCRGVLGAAADIAALKQLRIHGCAFLTSVKYDGTTMVPPEELAAALQQLPAGLEHLSLRTPSMVHQHLPTGVLQRLQQLSYLELAGFTLQAPSQVASALQPLEALTALVDLRLSCQGRNLVAANMLSGTPHLTRLELRSCRVEPGVLAGKTRLQHLEIYSGSIRGAARVAQLLSHLQSLQQLTHLSLTDSVTDVEDKPTAAAAYSALTASSKLQHLDVSMCQLPAGVWQHIFPAGRQLPHLRQVDISHVTQPSGDFAVAPQGSSLVSCCPGLQSLELLSVQCGAELLVPLQGLSGLTAMSIDPFSSAGEDCLQSLCQLTGLKKLYVGYSSTASKEGLLLHLSQLQQLTTLSYCDPHTWGYCNLTSQVS